MQREKRGRRELGQNAGFRRIRLEELLHEELASLLRDDVSDPDLYGVRITAVSLSVDYRNVRVHYVVYASARARLDQARVERALERATPFLRAQLAVAIDAKRVPDLRFVCDGEDTLADDHTSTRIAHDEVSS